MTKCEKKEIYIDDETLREICKMYYDEDFTQDEIAKKFFVSRTSISRYLKEAKQRHIVEIKINYPYENNSTIEKQLCEAFNLEKAYIVSAINPLVSEEYGYVCQMAAKAFDDQIDAETILGLSRGRTIKTIVRYLRPKRSQPEMKAIQLSGTMIDTNDPAKFEEIDMLRDLQEKYMCHSFCFVAPGITDTKHIKEVFIQGENVQRNIRLSKQLNFLLLSATTIDQWQDFLDEEICNKLKKKGAVGNLFGYFYDDEGNIIEDKVYERMIIPNRSIFNTSKRILVGAEMFKVSAIYAALNASMATSLVTSERIAQRLLRIYNEKHNAQ